MYETPKLTRFGTLRELTLGGKKKKRYKCDPFETIGCNDKPPDDRS